MILLHVIEQPGSFRTSSVLGQQRNCRAERAERLRQLAEHELGSLVATRIEVREGKPSAEIVRLAGQHQVALIVMGRHQHHGLRHWLRGHTASQLSKKAPCPVLLLQVGHRLN